VARLDDLAVRSCQLCALLHTPRPFAVRPREDEWLEDWQVPPVPHHRLRRLCLLLVPRLDLPGSFVLPVGLLACAGQRRREQALWRVLGLRPLPTHLCMTQTPPQLP